MIIFCGGGGRWGGFIPAVRGNRGGVSIADMPSDAFEAIYDTVYIHTSIFIPQLILEVVGPKTNSL